MNSSESAPLDHLALHARKALIARALLLDLIQYPDEDQELAIKSVLDLIEGDWKTQARNGQPLAEYLDDLAERVAVTTEAACPGVASVVKLTGSYVASLQSLTCCQGREPLCVGTTADLLVAGSIGLEVGGCLRFLQEVFDGAIALTVRAYGTAPRVDVTSTQVRLASGPGSRDVALTAETTFREEATGHVSITVAKITHQRFGSGDFWGLGYVLFHESFVHAYQARTDDSRNIRRNDAFAEGWMDRAAFETLSSFCERPDPKVWRLPARAALHTKDAAETYHGRRYAPTAELGEVLSKGSHAYQLLTGFARELVPEDHSLALRLSLEINAFVADLVARSALVEFVSRALLREVDPPAPERLALERFLRGYASGRSNAEDLVGRIQRLEAISR